MHTLRHRLPIMTLLTALGLPALCAAFNSGSTGADGALAPTVNTDITLPDSGVLNYTSIKIPVGVTVRFKKNKTNTPVVLLVAGDVMLAGTINLSGNTAAQTGTAGDGNQGDDGLPGGSGPGGFEGGRGGVASASCASAADADKARGGSGLGPGGGGGGRPVFDINSSICRFEGGAGGGFALAAAGSSVRGFNFLKWPATATGGAAYGSELLLPLIGGSGGGGGAGGAIYGGSGGGGGGGAILIAASGTVSFATTGKLWADGGWGGAIAGTSSGGSGGGGSGGAIRIVASTIAGNGQITAIAGNYQATQMTSGSYAHEGTKGSPGRIRLEADAITYSGSTDPVYTKGSPGTVFIAGLPSLKIISVAGAMAPDNPTGSADITLPADTTNPVTVTFQTTNVPLGNTVLLTVAPAYGPKILAQTPALTGTTESATASVQVTLPAGPSVLQATTTYTVLASVGDAMSHLAGNERVEKITVTAQQGMPSVLTLITASGKQFTVSGATLAAFGVLGG